MATITYYIGGVQVSSKNIWKIQDDGTTLSIVDSYLVGNVLSNIGAMAQDLDGNIYIAEGPNNWVYKYDSDMSLVTGWADNGIFKGSSSGISSLAVDTSGYLAIGCADDSGMYLVNDSGTEVWNSWLGSDPGDGITCIGKCRFDSTGNVVAAQSRNGGQETGAKYKRLDGSRLQDYWTGGADSHPYLCWVFSDNDVVLGWHPLGGNGCYVRKCNSSDVQEWSVTVNTDTTLRRGAITADKDENVYVGCNSTGTKTVYKLNALTGVTDASYDTGGGASVLDIDSNGNLVVGELSAAQDEDGDTAVLRIFNTSLNKLRHLTTASITEIRAVVARPSVEIVTTPPDDKFYSKKLIAIAANELWYESVSGTMSELSVANGDMDVTLPLSATTAFQKLFVANKTNLKVADFVNVKLVTSTLSATNYPESGNILTGSGSGATMVVDYCSSLTGTASLYGKLTSTASFVSTDTVSNAALSISFTLTAPQDNGPHWYNWTTFGNSSTFGTMPTSAYIICRYRGRLVLTGHPDYPHQWYMSKIGNPWSWLYGTLNPLSAVAGNNADAGECGDIIRALVPYGDDYLIFGCANSIWLLDGDPVSGGSLDEITNETGIFGSQAWCKDNQNNLYFWGNGGLYKMVEGRGKPQNISIVAYPKWVSDWAVESDLHRIVLSFDPLRNGIIISRTTLADGTNLNYWYDLKTDGFYPESYPITCGIYSSIYYDSDDSDTRGLLLGCNDGYIRSFLDTVKSDDSGATDTAVSSYMTLAPFPIGDGIDYEGKIKQIIFESSGGASGGDFSDSDGFSYGIYIANDAETCVENVRDGDTANLSGTISGTGRKSRIRQNIRGQYGTIRISNSTISTAFAINRILVDKDVAGRIKDV